MQVPPHQFLLHFNVNDLLYDDAYGYLPAVDYFMEQLNVLGCDLVLGYNTSHGIRLPNVGRWRNTHADAAPTYAERSVGETSVNVEESIPTWHSTKSIKIRS